MADEPVSAAQISAPVGQSSQSPAPSPSPSTPAAPAAPAVASTSTPASPAGTPPSKPDWLPSDQFWDGEKNELKGADLGKAYSELATWKAAEDVRKGALPQTPDAYKVELPADFKPPAGVEFKLDQANPSFAQLKAVAHKHGLTQEAVNELIGVYAGNEVGTESRIATARAAEVAKLGTAGPSRVDAVNRFLDASGLAVLKSGVITAAQVEAWEGHITKLTTQGGASFSQKHRENPEPNRIPGYENMSFEQRRLAQDQAAARRRA